MGDDLDVRRKQKLVYGHYGIALGEAPEVDLSGIEVKLPPGAFLQASSEAEGEMVALVREEVDGAKRIADLFAGLGTFALALARSAYVDAYEADEAALAALAGAARKTPRLKPVRTFIRDLFRSPLSAKELQGFDAVVFDPPRAGASAQAVQLQVGRAYAGRGVLQSRHACPRPPHPRRWRVSHHAPAVSRAEATGVAGECSDRGGTRANPIHQKIDAIQRLSHGDASLPLAAEKRAKPRFQRGEPVGDGWSEHRTGRDVDQLVRAGAAIAEHGTVLASTERKRGAPPAGQRHRPDRFDLGREKTS
jgi:hypothetical protein